MTNEEAIYIAGVIDGEGSIRTPIHIQLNIIMH